FISCQRSPSTFAAFRPRLESLEGRTLPSFVNAGSFPVGTMPVSVAAADFDGDGNQDLAVVNEGQPNRLGTVSILLGKGDGSFRFRQTINVGGNPLAVAVGDFNGDCIPDLAVVNYNSVSVLLGNGDGSFQPSIYYDTGARSTSVAVGDFNG